MAIYGLTLDEFLEDIPEKDIDRVRFLVNKRLTLHKELVDIKHRVYEINQELELLFKNGNPDKYDKLTNDPVNDLISMGR